MTPPVVIPRFPFAPQVGVGALNASGVVPVGPSRFVFIDNHDHTHLWELSLNPDGGQREPLKRRPLTGLGLNALGDPEGLTRIVTDDAIDLIVASSLSVRRNAAGQGVPQDGLVRVRYAPEGDLTAEAMPDFREWLVSHYPELTEAAKRDPDGNGLNVEGLAWDPERNVLLFGIRSPVDGGRIPVLQIHLKAVDANWTTAALEARPTLQIDSGNVLPAQAQGIRDITYDPEQRLFLVVLGRSLSVGIARFQLFGWDGVGTTVNELNVRLDNFVKPEGVTVFSEGGARKILIVDDAGGFGSCELA